MTEEVAAVFCDGGVIRMNPSPYGGTWAWRHVDRHGLPLRSASGLLLPEDAQSPVTSNLSELVALIYALESLPPGWSGEVCSDSRVTLGRVFGRLAEYGRWTNVPDMWRQRALDAVHRLGFCSPVHYKGHPTRLDLARGRRPDGQPVSVHQCWCDEACRAQALQFCLQHRIRPRRRIREDQDYQRRHL